MIACQSRHGSRSDRTSYMSHFVFVFPSEFVSKRKKDHRRKIIFFASSFLPSSLLPPLTMFRLSAQSTRKAVQRLAVQVHTPSLHLSLNSRTSNTPTESHLRQIDNIPVRTDPTLGLFLAVPDQKDAIHYTTSLDANHGHSLQKSQPCTFLLHTHTPNLSPSPPPLSSSYILISSDRPATSPQALLLPPAW